MEIGLKDDVREQVAGVLQKVLANQHITYMKLRNFHWNVIGKDFLELHKFFEELYTDLARDIDVIAERIRALDINTKATFAEYLQLADLKEAAGHPAPQLMVKELLDDYEFLATHLRESAATCAEIGDTGNEDILIGLMEKHEKAAWILRSILA